MPAAINAGWRQFINHTAPDEPLIAPFNQTVRPAALGWAQLG